MIWTKCQNMLRWSGQNANQKVGTDKMPTTEISPDKMPTFGWHYVRLAFCPVGILSAHLVTSCLLFLFSLYSSFPRSIFTYPSNRYGLIGGGGLFVFVIILVFVFVFMFMHVL